ncbi:unnamed protein product [Linum trigynum]|uniref:Uncharacterized protein n=1 Tax=Linum trigynum TaxID=586398 RepID=A0AAV2CJ53_9ROSI
MALPTFAMGSYGLLFRTKDGLFDIIDSAIAVAGSRWPDELEALRGQILKKFDLENKELSSAPAVAPRQLQPARNGEEISAEIVVSKSNRCDDDVDRGGRVNIEVKLRRPKNSSAEEAAVGGARDKPRESSLEEKKKVEGDRVLGFASEESGRGAALPRKEESCVVTGGGGRRAEGADDYYQRRRRSEDWYHRDWKRDYEHHDRYHGGRSKDGYYGGRKRNFDHDRGRYCDRSEDGCYGGRKRNFDHEERRHEEEYSRKRRRIAEEASATTTAGNHRVIQYSRRFLLSMRPMD